eukprot:gene20301-5821_t
MRPHMIHERSPLGDLCSQLPALRGRVGVNCGDAERQVVKLTSRSDYIGTVVNVASRVQSEAVGGTVAVTDAVLSAGVADPVEVSILIPAALAVGKAGEGGSGAPLPTGGTGARHERVAPPATAPKPDHAQQLRPLRGTLTAVVASSVAGSNAALRSCVGRVLTHVGARAVTSATELRAVVQDSIVIRLRFAPRVGEWMRKFKRSDAERERMKTLNKSDAARARVKTMNKSDAARARLCSACDKRKPLSGFKKAEWEKGSDA